MLITNEGITVDNLVLNLAALASSFNSSEIVRDTAKMVIEKQYFTVGEWLANISDTNLEMLLLMVEHEVDEESATTMLLLTEMLRMAEGLDVITDQAKLSNQMGFLICLFGMESLARKDLITFFRDKVSFSEDMANECIVMPKDGLAT